MAVSRNEMEHAASMVRAIRSDEWSTDPPEWADPDMVSFGYDRMPDYDRAIQTAEAFIMFFQAFNPRFDVTRFLVACGLQDAPVRKGGR